MAFLRSKGTTPALSSAGSNIPPKGITGMRHTFIAALLVATTASGALAQIPSYYAQGTYNLTSPTAFTEAVGGYFNPAVYPMMPGTEIEFYFSAPKDSPMSGLERWGTFTGLKNLGFGFIHQRGFDDVGNTTSVTDYRLALAGGTRAHSLGVSLGWQGGNRTVFNRTTVMQVGVVERFGRYPHRNALLGRESTAEEVAFLQQPGSSF